MHYFLIGGEWMQIAKSMSDFQEHTKELLIFEFVKGRCYSHTVPEMLSEAKKHFELALSMSEESADFRGTEISQDIAFELGKIHRYMPHG